MFSWMTGRNHKVGVAEAIAHVAPDPCLDCKSEATLDAEAITDAFMKKMEQEIDSECEFENHKLFSKKDARQRSSSDTTHANTSSEDDDPVLSKILSNPESALPDIIGYLETHRAHGRVLEWLDALEYSTLSYLQQRVVAHPKKFHHEKSLARQNHAEQESRLDTALTRLINAATEGWSEYCENHDEHTLTEEQKYDYILSYCFKSLPASFILITRHDDLTYLTEFQQSSAFQPPRINTSTLFYYQPKKEISPQAYVPRQ